MSSSSSSFLPQFLSRNLLRILGSTALFYAVAAFVLHTPWTLAVLITVGVGMFFLTYSRLAWGVAAAFFEIIIGAHGHIIDAQVFDYVVSLRMVIFIAVFAAWFLGVFQKRWHVTFVARRDIPFFALALLVVYGSLRGWLLGSAFGALFDDANVYSALFYFFPLASIVWTQEHKRLFLTTLFAGSLWVSLFTLVLTFVFTHISQEHIWSVYALVRDTRLYEVTLLSSPRSIAESFLGGDWYFRVFSQSQIFVVFYLFIFFSSIVFLRLGKKEKIPLVLWTWCVFFLATFFQSLSRSFFVGTVAGLFVLLFFWLMGGKAAWATWAIVARRKAGMLMAVFASLALLWTLISFPLPSRPDLSSSPFYHGDADNLRDLAVSTRWNMLPPLFTALEEHPVLGQGFGKELTYISDDPRIIALTHGSGEITTYRFEWGYLDIWLKMGIFGIIVHFWIFAVLAMQVFRNCTLSGFWSFAIVRERWLEIGCISSLAMLFAVHMFTPYLNHPIGLFYLLFCAFMIEWKKAKPQQALREEQKTPRAFFEKLPAGVSVRTR